MFKKSFVFGHSTDGSDAITVTKDTLYNPTLGYGFVTENNRNENPQLQISELNSAFEPQYWLSGTEFTSIKQIENGCYIDDERKLPLTFKLDVPQQGNYNVKVTIKADIDSKDLMIFSQRRRCMARGIDINAAEVYEALFTVNVCDIIPRGKLEVYTDKTIDITVIASRPMLTSIEVTQVTVPTVYIAGDSTVTDQSAAYPYDPATSYSGWAQMFPLYFKPGIAISNHAHSGLTTESFRKEGHYAIVEKAIQPGDFFFMQFAHNDQKLSHLGATTGYADNLRTYIDEIKAKGAFPVIVTPVSRTTWRGNDGGFNDLLIEYANACKAVGLEKSVPVLDLHAKSVRFITTVGLSDSTRYFYPKDWTHSNDYGAYLMASFVVEEIDKIKVTSVKDYIRFVKEGWAPPMEIVMPQPPQDYDNKTAATTAFKSEFTDIDDCSQKMIIEQLVAQGIIANDSKQFRPNEAITRVEVLNMVIKAVKFIPTNVYNDMYEDVVGHEWYAGTVECAHANGIVDSALLSNKRFKPNQEVTNEELISFCVNAYKSRKKLKNSAKQIKTKNISAWALPYVQIAIAQGLIADDFEPNKTVLRKEAAQMIKKLVDLI